MMKVEQPISVHEIEFVKGEYSRRGEEPHLMQYIRELEKLASVARAHSHRGKRKHDRCTLCEALTAFDKRIVP